MTISLTKKKEIPRFILKERTRCSVLEYVLCRPLVRPPKNLAFRVARRRPLWKESHIKLQCDRILEENTANMWKMVLWSDETKTVSFYLCGRNKKLDIVLNRSLPQGNITVAASFFRISHHNCALFCLHLKSK